MLQVCGWSSWLVGGAGGGGAPPSASMSVDEPHTCALCPQPRHLTYKLPSDQSVGADHHLRIESRPRVRATARSFFPELQLRTRPARRRN